MPTSRVGRPPSVEEALRRVNDGELQLRPVVADFDELAEQLYAATEPPEGMDPPATVVIDAGMTAIVDAQAPAAAAAPQGAGTPEALATLTAQADTTDGSAPAGDDVEVVTTEQLLDTLRTSSRNAVRRLAAVPSSLISSPAPGSGAGLVTDSDGLGELSKEVERAVLSAVAAANYQHDVESRATALASTIASDAAAEAERTISSARLERETMLAAASSEAKEMVSAGRAQRDAMIARAEAKAQTIVDQAEIELARRVHAISQRTDAIVDIAESASSRLAAGTLTGEQLAHFIAALGAATEQALASLEQSDSVEQSDSPEQ